MAESQHRKGKEEVLYHLRVQDAWDGDFWLHLEVPGSTELEELDDYLRVIWLECCDHLSQFSLGRGWGDEIPMEVCVDQVFERGVEVTHIYDFGTSSETRMEAVSVRAGKPTTPHPIALMARNSAPEETCIECDKPASWLCFECVNEDQVWGTLCDEHARTHDHADNGEPVPLANSPRLGMCGYTGPADPPY